MPTRISKHIVATLTAMIAGALLPGAAAARAEVYFLPSLALSELYDDNLFFAPSDQQEDFFLRLRPALNLGYRSLPADLNLNYSFDLERYNQHQSLDTNKARRDLSVDYKYRPSRIMTFGAEADYLKTRSPSELAALTGVQFGRVFAERRYLSPFLEYQYDNLTSTNARYEYTRDRITDGVGSNTDSVTLGVDRRLALHNSATFRYRFDRFTFDTGQAVNAHTLLFGGNYQYTPRLTFNVLAGPRFTSGAGTGASVSAAMLYQIERGELDVNYNRELTTVFGVGAAVLSQGLGATLSLVPVPDVELRAEPSYTRSTSSGLDTDVYRFLLEAGWQTTRYLTLFGSWEFAAQQGSLTSSGGSDVTHNVIMIGFVIAAPQRRQGETRQRIYLPSTLGGEPAPMPGALRQAPLSEEE